MPISLSPFLKPIAYCSQQQEDSFEEYLLSDFSRLTSNPSDPFTPCGEPIISLPHNTLSGFAKLPKKQKKYIYRSRRKTLLRIIS
jgi:hypothetical protein